MISRIINRIKRSMRPVEDVCNDNSKINTKSRVSQRELVKTLQSIPSWEDKINLYKKYTYSNSCGLWINESITKDIAVSDVDFKVGHSCTFNKINYGCGGNVIKDWLNIDQYQSDLPNYCCVNLLEKHPFPDCSINFGFSEDMLEHLNQAESIFFLGECFRVLKPGGVIRLRFPGLEGVLNRHYSPISEIRLREGEFEAYSFWDHIHFYSKGELELVASHIGFKKIEFVHYGESKISELRNLDTRENQMDLNTYVELTK
jgi:predicted SAM-dependent methyltransferase